MYGYSGDQIQELIHQQFRSYRATLQEDRRLLLERFEFVDIARKVVGVGSVGTRAFIVLLQGRDEQDPLFLQIKEATASVLEDHLPKSKFKEPGERVVQGQRLMQAASDIYLGWTKGVEANRHLYWRQLRDMKGSVLVETMTPVMLTFYAGMCGWTLARAHARSGDAVALAAYFGKSDNSTARSPPSLGVTPTRTSATTRLSLRRFASVASKPSRACDLSVGRVQFSPTARLPLRASHRSGHRRASRRGRNV